MINFEARGFAAGLGCIAVLAASAFAITPNPNLSIGKNLYVDGAVNSNQKPGTYTDGHLDANQIASVSDFALNVGKRPSKLFITWETRGDEAWLGDRYVQVQSSCIHHHAKGSSLENFKVMTSSNSTNGVDGDWETAAEVGESGAMSRGLAIDFAGKSWFRIVTDSPVANLEEIGAYDMSNGGDDTWFFLGTSITQMGMKQSEVDSSFAQLIHARYPKYYPVMLRGGVACVTSSGVVDGLASYSEYAGNVKYWAIEMGTNDAWGGSDYNLETFKANMQDIIDVAKRNGATPIIARMMATNPEVAGWQVHEDYLKAIEELTEENHLPKGPDFFAYFSNHPEELIGGNDGVHPNEVGAASMHRLWAEAMAPLYESGSVSDEGIDSRRVRFEIPEIRVTGKSIAVTGLQNNLQMTVMDVMGHAVENRNLPAGHYLVVIRDNGSSYSTKVTVK
ncbi:MULTISPECIES: SGNH/GDSL hydrolase family protein [unclassified Fibrobacter]|uniref:SGNH/GDSL hydrolase family protein n=1 Tax=unclassified Fibrobacter TaxID=2634177 RepID=UPI000D6D28F7|nr:MULTISPECIES: SGNH/GDSL hydrolase family protein [unclassified Fibrobacter]PWJ63396.1 lysophospholipase L1-like esterase [Fibrobacter sp. UWR4]PZW68331.1 lysophospholipase L1-like esterase [Fibrobacter sp. UWR1]